MWKGLDSRWLYIQRHQSEEEMNLHKTLSETINKLGYWSDYKPLSYGLEHGLFDKENIEWKSCLAGGKWGEVMIGDRIYLDNDYYGAKLFVFMWEFLEANRYVVEMSPHFESDLSFYTCTCYIWDTSSSGIEFDGKTRVEALAKCFISAFQ